MNSALRVFLSYRRDYDSAWAHTLRLLIHYTLNDPKRLPIVELFQDTQQRPGVSWPDEIRRRVDESDIVLAVIGPHWLGAHDDFGRRRIDQTDDWVRQELDRALEHGKPVLPVLFDCAPPPADALPTSLVSLASRQVVSVRHDHAEHDLQPLLGELQRRLGDDVVVKPSTSADRHALPYPDPPLAVPPTPLAQEDLQTALEEILIEWSETESSLPEDPAVTRHELCREFQFESFAEAVTFMSTMAPLIEQVNHHPRWENLYRTLRVFLSTWDSGHRVSYADVMLAQAFDRKFAEYKVTHPNAAGDA
jgi:pterin-4a-carbinolamine dehydratase